MSRQADEVDTPPGTPCWIELGTPAEARARSFYGSLLGWTFTIRPDSATGSYTVASAELPVGGLRHGDGPAAWSLYLAVRNAGRCAIMVGQLGGEVLAGPARLPGRGSIVHAVDAGGAPVVFWELPEPWQFGKRGPSTFGGADLNTRDVAATDHFYLGLFDFSHEQLGDGVDFDYCEWRLGGRPVLYRYLMGPEYQPDIPAHWMIYFEIEPATGVDALCAAATELGGNVAVAPYDSRYGRIAVLTDPDGATFSVIDRSRGITVPRTGNDDPYDD